MLYYVLKLIIETFARKTSYKYESFFIDYSLLNLPYYFQELNFTIPESKMEDDGSFEDIKVSIIFHGI